MVDCAVAFSILALILGTALAGFKILYNIIKGRGSM